MSTGGHRVAVYYQTQYDKTLPSNSPFGHYVSPLPLVQVITHLILAAFHINPGRLPDAITLNDNGPDDAYYAQMWQDIAQMQGEGVKVLGMLGGAAQGSYQDLTGSGFDLYYPQLAHYIDKYNLDGMDLDVEEFEQLSDVVKLINRLKSDFGSDFIITLAPVASALLEEGNLSGFDYVQLEQTVGPNISWYNAQFYSGFGHFFPDDQYIEIVEYKNGIFPPSKVVATSLTNSADGDGYIDPSLVVLSAKTLSQMYGYRFGGVAGWEYFNSEPNPSQPWQWATMMHNAMQDLKAKALLVGKPKFRL